MLPIGHMPLEPWCDSFLRLSFNDSFVFLHTFTNVYICLNNILLSSVFILCRWLQIEFALLWLSFEFSIIFLGIYICMYLIYCNSLTFTLHRGPRHEYIAMNKHITFCSCWTFVCLQCEKRICFHFVHMDNQSVNYITPQSTFLPWSEESALSFISFHFCVSL